MEAKEVSDIWNKLLLKSMTVAKTAYSLHAVVLRSSPIDVAGQEKGELEE